MPARSNGGDQGTDADCEANVPVACSKGEDDRTNRTCSYGEHYQCVEYVRRFYSLRSDSAERMDTSSWKDLNANQFITNHNGMVISKVAGFTAFPNGGTTPPLPDDIIVFNGGGFGHVAIVKSVTSTQVQIIEENFNYAGVYGLSYSQATNRISPRPGGHGGVFIVVGWLREASTIRNNPVPTIAQLSPHSALAGSNEQKLTITGTGFIPESVVTFNGAALTTTYIGSTALTASLSRTNLETAGSFQVVVVNPGPGGGRSSLASFSVNDPVPTITSVWPQSLSVGSAPQPLTINGTGFVPTSSLTLNSTARAPTYVSASQVIIPLRASDLASAGNYPVVVTNPSPGGGASPAKDFAIISGDTSNDWTWMSGASSYDQAGVYGTQGYPSALNIPGAWEGGVSWRDSNDSIFLFGGYGLNSAGAAAILNDLWKFSISRGTWTWVRGNSTQSGGAYGALRVPASTNMPGGRVGAAGWTDSRGNFWLLGGAGLDSKGKSGYLNDLWRMNIATSTWTWMGGSNAVGTNGYSGANYGTKGVPAATNVPGGREWCVIWADNKGDIWLFGGFGFDSGGEWGNLNDLWEFNTATGTWTWVSGSSTVGTFGGRPGVYGVKGVPSSANTPGGRERPDTWIDADGNLWIFGGSGADSTGAVTYLNDLWNFDTDSSVWTWEGGSKIGNQVGIYGTRGSAESSSLPGGRGGGTTWTDASGNVWLFGGQGYASTSQEGSLNDLWKLDPNTGLWAWMTGSNSIGTYGYTLGNYGIQGIPTSTNTPGSRDGIASWMDRDGDLWLFGGYACDDITCQYNDLWRYRP